MSIRWSREHEAEYQKRANQREAKFNREQPDILNPWKGEAAEKGKDWRTAQWRTCGFAGWNYERSAPEWFEDGCRKTTWTHARLKLCDTCYAEHQREIWATNKATQRAGKARHNLKKREKIEPLPKDKLPPCHVCGSTNSKIRVKIVNFRPEPMGYCLDCDYFDEPVVWWLNHMRTVNKEVLTRVDYTEVPAVLKRVELLSAAREVERLQLKNLMYQRIHREKVRPIRLKIRERVKIVESYVKALEEMEKALWHARQVGFEVQKLEDVKSQIQAQKAELDAKIVLLGSKIENQ